MNTDAKTVAGKTSTTATDSTGDKVSNAINIRLPDVHDGKYIWQLIKDVGVLDLNSAYCYLLLCDHFRDTCAVAEMNGEVVGFVTAYLLPADETTLFVWQVGTAAAARGHGIAKKLILELLERKSCGNVTQITATISPSNEASLGLFNSLASHLQTGFNKRNYYDRSLFPENGHEQEDLVTVGPFK